MQDNSGFYGPLSYSQAWLWMGVLVLLVVAAWYVFLFWPRRERTRGTQPVIPRDLAGLRTSCLQAIDSVVADADAGRLPERAAHQRLSFLVREFAGHATGKPATSMTLDELRRHGLEPFVDGIAGIYPAEFEPVSGRTVQDSAAAARQAVRAWN
ncbi:hypothetical protein ACIQTZ_03025 [Paenarthrobacter sp. NPDC090520]|uniref:hypothetical protein n=1 Tax=Paenarthrobacter sp. NPDC090520 TaxID=3364382 RepID=UPI0038015F79